MRSFIDGLAAWLRQAGIDFINGMLSVNGTLQVGGNILGSNIVQGYTFVALAKDANNKLGYITRKTASAKATLSGASTSIAVAIPSNCKIIAIQLAVPTTITSAVGASWSAIFSGGNTAAICTSQSFVRNTKSNIFYSELKMLQSAVTTNTTNITITPNAGAFTGGEISAIVYYEELTSIAD